MDDLEYVGSILEKNLRILSSFEKYVKEISTEKLEWTPVHNEKFWRENIKKFEEQDFHLIKFLIFFFFFFHNKKKKKKKK